MLDPKEDENHFGKDTWIYCSQHMRPHTTGWCTVSLSDKVRLDSNNLKDAQDECRSRGLELYVDFLKELEGRKERNVE